MWDGMTWLNEPAQWSIDTGELHVTTGSRTDFWRHTFYGFVRDDGHVFARPVTGDFTAEVTVSGEYETLYDQCGLMVRADAEHWVKSGVEFTDGVAHVSTVVTNGFSDWSVVPAPEAGTSLTLRVTRHGDALRVQYRRGSAWQLTRLAYVDLPETVAVGVMACSPERSGFRATFTDLEIGPAIDRSLH